MMVDLKEEETSDCCGASCELPELGICPECGEHCEFTSGD